MKYIFTSMIMALASFVYGQANYQPGFVITTQSDTLKGFINYQEWNNNPKKIAFRKTPDGKTIEFTPQTIRGFNVSDLEIYKSAIVSISTDKVSDLSLLSTGADSTSITDTVFLKVLYPGKKLLLYAYIDEIKPRYYIQTAEDHTPKELTYREYYDSASKVVTKRKYQQQLILIAIKLGVYNADIMNTIAGTGYNAQDLKKCVMQINGDSEKRKNGSASHIRWIVGAGINASTAYYKGDNALAGVNATSKASYTPQISGGLDWLFNPNTGRNLIHFGLSALVSKPEITLGKPGDNVFYKHSFTQYTLSFSPQYVYNIYNKEAFKFFVGTGFAINLSKYYNNKNLTVYSNNSATYDHPVDLQPAWLSIPVKAGALINRNYGFTLTYLAPAGSITNYLFYGIYNRMIQASFNYVLGKHK
ncbi:hypothetical protein FW774_13030 [Pedobacter sp. BS3]|uniref:hypothetical protein n=1 Tax=Pedobacter sp. BS3 TaxID=2567937 RepID=UPI0011ECC47A|nr:hypothetical protein [Pedobacter sp. BS3]TZF83210.1 hypothetical protein FW774_13030 [Pedobacter sp. BS3]